VESSQNTRTALIAIIILIVLVAGYVSFGKHRSSQEGLFVSPSDDDSPAIVVVENAIMTNGVLPVPTGFPQDIPIEKEVILESAVTHYPEQNAEQLSLSYQSSKTIAQKYTEYINYIRQAGYDITEEDTSSPMKSIFGIREDANLSVAISRSEGQTLVQLSYLLKSVSN
jgi:hypothetical protein